MEQIAALNHNLQQLLAQMQREGVLDEQFMQLLQLQDDSNPDFVAEVVQLYFEDSVSKLDRMQQLLMPATPDFNELDQLVHQFKGSSASLGAQVVAQLCIRLREACQQQDAVSSRGLLQQMREAFGVLKSKLDVYMQLDIQRKQLMGAGGGS